MRHRLQAILLSGIAAGRLVDARAATPMDFLRTVGPAADPVTRLNWGLMVISGLVVAIIAALVLVACLRRRPPLQTDAAGRLPVHPDRGGSAWIYIGVGISIIVLFGSTVWTLRTLAAVAAPAAASGMTVRVTARQWWWEVRYADSDSSHEVVTANEIHIPVGVPVRIELRSADVIHSFWVPKLAGKTDVIPGQTNLAWVQADAAGEYRGQCAEFCGPQHAHMAMHIVAEKKDRFDAWLRLQRDAAVVPQSSQALRGQKVFDDECARCHTIRGTSADGEKGPDLTHLMSRRMIAAGTLPNNTGALSGWVADAQSVKPGALMPSADLDPHDLQAVVGYLQTLQ